MTTIDSEKLRDLVRRMHANSLQIQEANKMNNPHYCTGWRGATNTYAIELLALVDREAAAQAQPQQIHVRLQNVASIDHVGVLSPGKLAAVSVNGEKWPECIDCGVPCAPERNPLRCLVCQLDAEVAETRAAEMPAGLRVRSARRAALEDLELTATSAGMLISKKDPQQ